MARITVFQQGIGRDAPQVTPLRAPDFGPGIGPGLQKLGEVGGEVAQKIDEIQDVGARIEANKHAIAFNDLTQNIGARVKSTLGDGAEAAADQGIADLQKGADDILAEASPRARAILAPQIQERLGNTRGEWTAYGFEQKKQAFDTSSQAANDKDLDTALHQDTDQAAKPYLDSIAQRNHQRASFFGLGSDWETQENLKAVSGFHKGRALALGVNSGSEAIKYATEHRGSMSADDYEAVVRAYRASAIDEQATVAITNMPLAGDQTTSDPLAPLPDGAPAKRADPSLVFKSLILPNEGSKLVAHDSNGAPVKYGINQKANPDVDVANLTQAGAEKLFVERYWKPSGADKLSPALAAVHADTYYLNPAEATKILKESGGDVQRYMELRNNFLAQLHASDPARYPDYTGRNKRVEAYAASLGGDGTPLSFSGNITPSTSITQVTNEVMARQDMPLALKTAIINKVREQRAAMREDKQIEEDDARDALVTQSTKLGENFTDIKQLPGDALAKASPETIASLTDLARTNRYKHNDETLRPYVTSILVTDPSKFVSKDFVTELMRKGASPSLISEVQTQQATIAKNQMNAKPDVVSSGELWTIAKPAFQASGLDYDTAKGKSATKRQQDAAQKEQALVFLNREATDWANAHPGEKATEQVMRQWVGTALLKTRTGSPLFQATDQDVYNSIPDAVRNTIIRDLRRGGVNSTGSALVSDVAAYYRKLRTYYGTGPINLAPGGRIEGHELRGIPQSSAVGGMDQ